MIATFECVARAILSAYEPATCEEVTHRREMFESYKRAVETCDYEIAIQLAIIHDAQVIRLANEISYYIGIQERISAMMPEISDQKIRAIAATLYLLQFYDPRFGRFSPSENLRSTNQSQYENAILHCIPRPFSISIINTLRAQKSHSFIDASTELMLLARLKCASLRDELPINETIATECIAPSTSNITLVISKDHTQYAFQGAITRLLACATVNVDIIARTLFRVPRANYPAQIARNGDFLYIATQILAPLHAIDQQRESADDFIINCAFRVVMGLSPRSASRGLFRGTDGSIFAAGELLTPSIMINSSDAGDHIIQNNARKLIAKSHILPRECARWHTILCDLYAFESAIERVIPERSTKTGITPLYLRFCIARLDQLLLSFKDCDD